MARPSQFQTGLGSGIQGLAEGFSSGLEAEEGRKQRQMVQQALESRKEEERKLKRLEEDTPPWLRPALWSQSTNLPIESAPPEMSNPNHFMPMSSWAHMAGIQKAKIAAAGRKGPQPPTPKPFGFGDVPRMGLQDVTRMLSERFGGAPLESLPSEALDPANTQWRTYAGGKLAEYAQQKGAKRLAVRPGNLLTQGEPVQPSGLFSAFKSPTPGKISVSQSPWELEPDVMQSVVEGRAGGATDEQIQAILASGGIDVPIEIISAVPRAVPK